MQIEPKKIIQKSNHQVEQIVFMMTGSVEVGFNNLLFLESFNLRIATRDKTPLPSKTILSTRIFRSLAKPGPFTESQQLHQEMNRSHLPGAAKKFHFPVTIPAGGCPIGIFEASFHKKSQFIYRAKKGPDSKNHFLESFFVRLRNWKELI
mmetsp:Transcript_25435/g.39224  ORF Transcript_25435/g.39224 Transcript_25435/m.39224 type:complete len:150 (+) Transcript_25435:1143-1592(+)